MPKSKRGSRNLGRWLAASAATCFLAATFIAAGAEPSFAVGTYRAAVSSSNLGGVDLQKACNLQYSGQNLKAVASKTSGPGSAYTWRCTGPGVSKNIDVGAACRAQYGYGAVSAVSNPNSAYSWYCYWNITPTMQAAINWSIAHANSQNWNFLCETEVEKAYGTIGQFLSAMDDYQWMKVHGHIHTGDRNAPGGALVFFNGSTSSGHVGLAAGDGVNYYTTDGGTIHLAPLTEGGTVYYGWSFPPPTANWQASW